MPLKIDLTEAPAQDEVGLVERGLVGFNAAASATPDDRRPLCAFIRDEGGEAFGGPTGYTRWGWLYLDCFWLPEQLRRDGWGSRILSEAEREGRNRGCGRARLFTYSFQAQHFYEKHGYRVFGILDDYPPGHRQIFMRKDLDGRSSAPGVHHRSFGG